MVRKSITISVCNINNIGSGVRSSSRNCGSSNTNSNRISHRINKSTKCGWGGSGSSGSSDSNITNIILNISSITNNIMCIYIEAIIMGYCYLKSWNSILQHSSVDIGVKQYFHYQPKSRITYYIKSRRWNIIDRD